MGARRRSRRDDELSDVAAVDPVLHERLLELRRTHPAGFRRELARLVRRGVIPGGRERAASPDVLALVAFPVGRALAEIRHALQRGVLDRHELQALIEEERRGRAREPVMGLLEQALTQATADRQL